MIKHIALFDLANEAEGQTKEKNLQQILANVERLKNEVPIEKRIEVSQPIARDRDASWSADVVVYVEFNSVEDYEAYVAHPIHIECAGFASSVSSHFEGITYESKLAVPVASY